MIIFVFATQKLYAFIVYKQNKKHYKSLSSLLSKHITSCINTRFQYFVVGFL